MAFFSLSSRTDAHRSTVADAYSLLPSFLHCSDDEQVSWNRVFFECGLVIVLVFSSESFGPTSELLFLSLFLRIDLRFGIGSAGFSLGFSSSSSSFFFEDEVPFLDLNSLWNKNDTHLTCVRLANRRSWWPWRHTGRPDTRKFVRKWTLNNWRFALVKEFVTMHISDAHQGDRHPTILRGHSPLMCVWKPDVFSR